MPIQEGYDERINQVQCSFSALLQILNADAEAQAHVRAHAQVHAHAHAHAHITSIYMNL